MSTATSFNDAFWGTDFLGTVGFDILTKRLHDGKSLCKDVDTYLKQRSRVELEYSKNLSKLHQSLKFRGSTGQLEDSWKVFRDELDKSAKIHKECGQFIQQLGEETHKYIDDTSNKRKDAEEKTKKSHQNKVTLYNRTINLKKTYDQRCREYDISKETYATSKSSVTTTSKELEKSKTQETKNKEQMEKADNAYEASTKALEEARCAWENEMSNACEVFQLLEEDRINYLRDLMWTCANLHSTVAVDVDMCCERIRTSLDTCDVAQDIGIFIEQSRTDNKRPVPILYENYYNEYENHSNSRL